MKKLTTKKVPRNFMDENEFIEANFAPPNLTSGELFLGYGKKLRKIMTLGNMLQDNQSTVAELVSVARELGLRLEIVADHETEQ